MYFGSTYLLASTILTIFSVFVIIVNKKESFKEECTIDYTAWYTAAVAYYVCSAILSLLTLAWMKLNSHRRHLEMVTLHRLKLMFRVYKKWQVLIPILLIDAGQFALMVSGFVINFREEGMWTKCAIELPIEANMILIFLILGVMYSGRFFMSMIIFHFGSNIAKYLRNRFPQLRPDEVRKETKFPAYKYSDYIDATRSADQDCCPICCEDFQPEVLITVLRCNIKHIYHEGCIEEWLNKNTVCPICK